MFDLTYSSEPFFFRRANRSSSLCPQPIGQASYGICIWRKLIRPKNGCTKTDHDRALLVLPETTWQWLVRSNGTARGEEDGTNAACCSAPRSLTSSKARPESLSTSGVIFTRFGRCFFLSINCSAKRSGYWRSGVHPIALGRLGSDFRRTRSAFRHRCEPSTSLRLSSILTEPSVLLQRGHVEASVPLSLCLRRNLRGC
jgi:hypothetical protein